jgi:hypothetical protein
MSTSRIFLFLVILLEMPGFALRGGKEPGSVLIYRDLKFRRIIPPYGKLEFWILPFEIIFYSGENECQKNGYIFSMK